MTLEAYPYKAANLETYSMQENIIKIGALSTIQDQDGALHPSGTT
jgi:hypothetical protein